MDCDTSQQYYNSNMIINEIYTHQSAKMYRGYPQMFDVYKLCKLWLDHTLQIVFL